MVDDSGAHFEDSKLLDVCGALLLRPDTAAQAVWRSCMSTLCV